MRLSWSIVVLGSVLSSCTGSTGGDLVTFAAAASGPADAGDAGSAAFTNDRGWRLTLSRAVLHVGAMYLNQSQPVSGAQYTSCILNGTYVAQVTSGLDVDLLLPAPQPFPTLGTGVAIPALAGQVWLTGGDVNTVDDPTPILSVAGVADQNGTSLSFTGTITIGANRVPSDSTALAGANPICKQRIVSPIPTSVEPRPGGTLYLRVDPHLLFTNIDFSQVPAPTGLYAFPDDASDQPSRNLYQNLHSWAPYRFEWLP